MSTSRIVGSLTDHFERMWAILREAIEAFPEEQWRTGDVEHLIPARQALHIVGTADFYSGDWEGARFPWDGRTGCDWEDAPREKLPSREQLLAYLDDVRARIEAWLTKRGDGGLTGEPADKRFPWTGECELGRALHLMRHAHHHLGKLHAELRRRGIDRPEWR
jgi:uncharacterized damage-inducible protein DinB